MSRPRSKRNTTPILQEPLGPNRALRRLLAHEFTRLRPTIAKTAAACDAERYRKHFDSFAHACLLLFHGLSRGHSLRQSYAAFASCPGMLALSGLGTEEASLAVSFSQFAASNTSRPAAFLANLLPVFVTRMRQRGVASRHLPSDLYILDATFLRVSLTLADWLPQVTQTRNHGVRVQCLYHPDSDLPQQVAVTTVRRNDVQSLDAMLLDDPAQVAALAGQTLLIDLGYYSHRRFAGLRAAGVHFVTRLHHQAMLAVTAERPIQCALPAEPALPPDRITVLADQQITLGSPNNRAGAVLEGMRLVTALVQPTAPAARRGDQPHTYRILTDRFDLAPDLVVQSYLWRWQIELFFRWLKSHLKLPRLLGYSQNAIELSVALALFVHLLCLLAAEELGHSRRTPTLLAHLPWALAQVMASDAAPASSMVQLPLPGWPTPATLPT